MPLRPTLKQKKFAHEYLRTGQATKAAMIAYDVKSRQSAAFIGYQNLKKPIVVDYMKEIMDRHGLSDEQIAERLKKVIEAGTSEVALREATPTQALKAIDMTMRVKDLYPAEKKQIDQRTATLKMDLKGKTDQELVGILTNLQDELTAFKKMVAQTAKLKQ